MIEGIIDIKQPMGYDGLCPNGPGIHEYVRFYIDFSKNGTFTEQFEDLGVAKLHVFDPHKQCWKNLPICYGINLKICLPGFMWDKIKCKCFTLLAIHQTGYEPPANDPNYIPFYGSIIRRNIRFHP